MLRSRPLYLLVCPFIAVLACSERSAPSAPAQRASSSRPAPVAQLGEASPTPERAAFLRWLLSQQTEVTVTPQKVQLGRWLFFDTRLSIDGTISCASCHRPDSAFADIRPVSVGVHGRKGHRKSPTFLNGTVQHRPDHVFFWDGRAPSLAAQAKEPIVNPDEMGHTAAGAVAAIAGVAGYRASFARVYGDDRVDLDRIADAIAAYEATRVSGNSAYDRFRKGDLTALSVEAQRGKELFFGKAQCSRCHFDFNFTDSQFHNLGIGLGDEGRAAVTGLDQDRGAFKTPTLRDVSRHPPYMHDGSLPTLRAVVEHYNRGGTPNPWLSREIELLGLDEGEVMALVAFMHALDGEGWQDSQPTDLPR